MNVLSQIPYVVEILLDLTLLYLLIRGPLRRFLVFFFYILLQVVTHAIVGSAYYTFGYKSAAYRNSFWLDELTAELFLFLVVIAFTYAALRDSPLRAKAAKTLGVIVVATLALPFAMLHNHHSKLYGFFNTQWFHHASQIWNFGAAIMNLVLWAALLSNRRRDPQLVTLSIGVGIATASAAIAWGARQWLAADNRGLVDDFRMLTHLASLLLWCWVFRPRAPRQSSGTTRPGSSTPPTGAPPLPLTTPS